jgi:hypothetical protein
MEATAVKKTRKPREPKEAGTVAPKHPGGRPTKYDISFCEAMSAYFSKEVGFFPTLAGFAASIGVTRDTLHEWANAKTEEGTLKHPEFSDAYKRAKEMQEQNLVIGALTGAYNASFAIFTAKNVLGWRDKTEQEITGKDGSPLAGIQVMFVNPDGSERDTEH